jgi:hypothetical protein
VNEDAYGLPLTTNSDAAAAGFRLAADHLLAAVGDPLSAADAAVEADPDMALAHSVRAMALLFRSQPKPAKDEADAAVRLAAHATRRERQHAAIVLDVVTGQRDAGLAKIRAHVQDFPRDALAINPAAGVFGLLGFSGRQNRESEQLALLEPLAEHYGDDWWYQHVLAFALLEHDAVERALPLVESALSRRPDSGHAAHTYVHALFEAKQHPRAMAWLAGWAPGYAADGILYCHLWWHLALFHLHRHDFGKMWEIYDAHCRAGQSASLAINLFTDGVSLAWRAMVAGAERPIARLEALRTLGEENFPKPGIFVDVHRAACLAALGDRAALAAFRGDLAAALAAGKLAAGAVVIEIADGFEAFAEADWTRARDILAAAQPSVVRIGGSRAQRRIVSETLAVATERAGAAN